MTIKNIIKKQIYKFLFFIIFILFQSSNSFADKLKNFKILGNQRVSDETIIMFSNLSQGQILNKPILNNVLKDLYYTDYFSDVKLNFTNGELQISVIERPIIQNIIIEGVKKDKVYESIQKITKKSEKYPFIENKLLNQVNLIKNTLKSFGYYFSEIDTKKIENENNTVDILYNINLGEIAKIKKITFIGDKIFKDSTLRNIISSEESKFWKFITIKKYLDINRINRDVELLSKFYLNKGYFNVNIKSSSAKIINDTQFELIFNINAGNKFTFNEIFIKENPNIETGFYTEYLKKYKKLKNKKYSKKVVNKIVDEINKLGLENEYVFLDTKFNQIIKENNKIDVEIYFKEIDKVFVNRINVLGNYITDEKVVRNSFLVDEGDPYNEILFKKSLDKIRSKNIFKNVDASFINEKNNTKDVNITVEEKPTGEIFAGAGTGTTGSSLSAGIKENNYLGKGIKLNTEATITDDQIKGKFTVQNPNFLNSDKSLNTTIESTTTDFFTSSGYKSSRTGFTVGTGFEQYKDVFLNLEISNYYENLETSSTASSVLKKQDGDYFENLITYSLSLNKLDQNFKPTDGSRTYFQQILPLYSEDWSVENSFSQSNYFSVSDNLILSSNFLFKAINAINDENVRVSKRVYVPGRNLRGFESGKIGPKDGSQFIGGNYASSLNLNSTLPNLLFENEDIDFNFFVDMANVWHVDYDSSLDGNKIRSSTGIAVNWFSPIGPLSFSYAVPISDAETDIKEKFRFQIGTSF